MRFYEERCNTGYYTIKPHLMYNHFRNKNIYLSSNKLVNAN